MKIVSFENTPVQFMLRQATQNFVVLGAYSNWFAEQAQAQATVFKDDMTELTQLLQRISDRVRRQLAVPQAWLKRLSTQAVQAIKLIETQNWMPPEVIAQFYRTLRFLSVYRSI